MLGFVDVHEAVSLQEGLRHHLEFVVPGGRVPSPRTRQGAFLSLWAALAGLPTSRLGGGEGLLPVHLRLGRESCSDLALQLRAVKPQKLANFTPESSDRLPLHSRLSPLAASACAQASLHA